MTTANTGQASGNMTFEVFGRDQLERPLSHIGSIRAPNQDLAVARARFMYSERQWVELCVVPPCRQHQGQHRFVPDCKAGRYRTGI